MTPWAPAGVPRGEKCPKCGKIIRTRTEAARKALDIRTGIRRLSARRAGLHRVHAYECPHGHGWHIGRRKKRRRSGA